MLHYNVIFPRHRRVGDRAATKNGTQIVKSEMQRRPRATAVAAAFLIAIAFAPSARAQNAPPAPAAPSMAAPVAAPTTPAAPAVPTTPSAASVPVAPAPNVTNPPAAA